VAQYLTLTVLRTQIESSMAPMMTPLLTCRGSWQLCSDDFITPPPPTSSSSRRRSRRPEEHPPGLDLPRTRCPKRPPLVLAPARRSVDPLPLSVSTKKKGNGNEGSVDRQARKEGSRGLGWGAGAVGLL
jgi:hypothetical protein